MRGPRASRLAGHALTVRRQPGGGSDTTVIRFQHIAPHFYASDMRGAQQFYESVLGFALDYVDGEPPQYLVMCRDDVYVHLSQAGLYGAALHPGAAFVAVVDVDALWAEVRGRRECVVADLTDADYGSGVRFRVFAVRDPDGNVLRLGEPYAPVATQQAHGP